MTRPCSHPHKTRASIDELQRTPLDPLGQRLQLILHTEVGPLPYGVIANLRALKATYQLVTRHLAARTITGFDIVPGEDYHDPRHKVGQLVICGALAEFEERFCVADWCREQVLQHLTDGI